MLALNREIGCYCSNLYEKSLINFYSVNIKFYVNNKQLNQKIHDIKFRGLTTGKTLKFFPENRG